MKQLLTKLCGKIVKLYLRNEQNFSARIMSIQDDVVYVQSQHSDIYILISEIIVVTLQMDTPLADAPTKNMYHPTKRGY